MGFFNEVNDFWEENAGVILGTAGGVAGGIVAGPVGAMAGASLGQSVGGAVEGHVQASDAANDAARVQRETLQRERSMLITQRTQALEGPTRVQYGGATYGSPDDASTTGPTGGLLAPEGSLLARGEYTGLSLVNPSIGAR